jgi:hypothetical protein
MSRDPAPRAAGDRLPGIRAARACRPRPCAADACAASTATSRPSRRTCTEARLGKAAKITREAADVARRLLGQRALPAFCMHSCANASMNSGREREAS